MPHAKLTIARPDQATLLTVAVLTLAKNLRVSSAHAGRIVVKYQPGRRYLTLTLLQWTVLKTFEEGRSVPTALKHLVHERSCIPLHEYYELILQALEAGVLQTPGYPRPEPDPPAAWRFSLSSSVLRPLGSGLFVVALILLFFNPATAPAHPAWWLAGWLVNCIAASAGAFLSASVVHAAAGDIYRPRLNLRTLLPRFSVDTEDALLHGPGAAIDLALARLTPFAALCALVPATAPSLCLPLFCGLLWNLAPLPGQPAFRLLRALHHSPALTTSHGRLLPPNRRLRRRLHLRLSRDNLRFAAVLAGCAPLWLALTVVTWIATHEGDPAYVLHFLLSLDWSTIAFYYGLGLLISAVVAASAFAISHAAESIARRRAAQQPRPTLAPTLPLVSDVTEFLARTHPFQLVPSAKREAAARAMQFILFNSGDVLLAKGDKRPRLYVLYSGEARSDAIDPLHPVGPSFASGSIFGEACLLRGEPQPAAVHATEPGVLLVLDQTPYLAIISPHVPAHKMADAAQKVALLRQSALARHWPPHLLESFARRAELLRFNSGDVILKEGQENLWFHLLLEGELHVVRKRRRIGRIRAGDFFGEISLLQNGFASTDIVGHRPGRYLSVPKNDFLFFFAHDPAVAMQFEAVASRRLGRPVFPL